MARRLLLVAVATLVALGCWARGATNGYEQGKAHAAATLKPSGAVIIGDGQCVFYPPTRVPELDPARQYRAFFVTLLTPDDGR